MSDNKCSCGEESTIAGHGIVDGEVYSLYHCDSCYSESKRSGNMLELTEEDL